jgi:hypothetical protein
MSKPIQIAIASACDNDSGVTTVEQLVLCDDGRIFARTLGYSEDNWTEVHGPWEKK